MVYSLPFSYTNKVLIKLTFTLLLLIMVSGEECTCHHLTQQNTNTTNSLLTYKLAAVASILVAGAIGVSLPQLGKKVDALNPENNIFFMVKAFAAGVILSTGFIHILPEAFNRLTSPCLGDKPWGSFPLAGFVAMMAAIGTLMVDTFATNFYQRLHFNKPKDQAVLSVNEEGYPIDEHAGHIHVHAHATDGHAHGSAISSQDPQLIRHRIISQVKHFHSSLNSRIFLSTPSVPT